jgi:hypothetical protein
MIRSIRRLVVLVFVACALGACTTSASTPRDSGPAFEMVMLKEVKCPGDATAACATVRVVNHGDPGAGRCQLRGYRTDASGQTHMIWGESIDVSGIETGGTLTQVTPWHHGLPAVGYCNPALHS